MRVVSVALVLSEMGAYCQICQNTIGVMEYQAVTTCGLSSLASFLKKNSSKRVCCVFRDIRDKNAVNQGFWSKTAVFSLPATKVDCLLIFWLPHLRSEDRGPRIEERRPRIEDRELRIEDRGLRTED